MMAAAIGLGSHLVTMLFGLTGQVFGGERIVPLVEIVALLGRALGRLAAGAAVPAALLLTLKHYAWQFYQRPGQRRLTDHAMRYVLLAAALSAVLIVALIFVFTISESTEAIRSIGVGEMLTGTIWRPGVATASGTGQFGLLPMILGSVLSTVGAVLLGVPISVGTAVLLAEIAPHAVREIVRPAIELLAGIPSVVYGLFGMVVLAPIVRMIEVPYNTGFGLLTASIILAVMIIPTVTNIAEDAIRAVPKAYREGSLALGATHWQTIVGTVLPSARSGLIAAVILGIGRALGETMALIMVIGNAIAMPEPLTHNLLTIVLAPCANAHGQRGCRD